MPYKTILVHLNDKRRAEALLEPAVALAARNNAHLVGMHVHTAVPAPPINMPYSGQVLGAMVATERKDTEEIAAIFQRMTKGQPFVAEWRAIKVPQVDLASVVMDHGRAADLIVAGQTDPDWDLSPVLDFPERLALESGRPVLVIPYVGRYPVGSNAVIAWKPGREASRAVFDALPLLEAAEKVQILEVRAKGEEPSGLAPDTSIAAALGRHGIKPTVRSTVRRHQHRRRDTFAARRHGGRSAGHGRLRPLAHARDGIRRRHPPHRPAHDRADAALALSGGPRRRSGPNVKPARCAAARAGCRAAP